MPMKSVAMPMMVMRFVLAHVEQNDLPGQRDHRDQEDDLGVNLVVLEVDLDRLNELQGDEDREEDAEDAEEFRLGQEYVATGKPRHRERQRQPDQLEHGDAQEHEHHDEQDAGDDPLALLGHDDQGMLLALRLFHGSPLRLCVRPLHPGWRTVRAARPSRHSLPQSQVGRGELTAPRPTDIIQARTRPSALRSEPHVERHRREPDRTVEAVGR